MSIKLPSAATALAGAVLLLTSCAQPTDPAGGTTTATPVPTRTVTAIPEPDAPAAPAVLTPLLAEAISAPVPVPATDGKDHLAYELKLTNTLPQELTLTSLTVLAGDQTMLSLAGYDLEYWTRAIGMPVPTRILGPGQSALVWLDVAVDRPADGGPNDIPAELSHRIEISVADPSPPLIPPTMTENVAPVTVSTRRPAVIAPPLDGPNWLSGDSCCDMTAHRTAANPINGQLFLAERFAVDYVQLGPDGRLFTGDRAAPESYPYYGSDIHAVADGPVVAVLDGLPEQVPGANPTGLTIDQYGGNHIVQDIGDGNYAFYAHLETGSTQVEVGDQLARGQVIAALGNSGNTDAPHLHFHVMNGPDPLASDGLPFVFEEFTLDSRVASMEGLDPILDGQPAPLQPGFASQTETGVSPLVLDVMSYDIG